MASHPDHPGQGTRSTELLSDHEHEQRVRGFRLTVVDGPDVGATLHSRGDDVVIGTHESASFRLTDRSVSRLHCEIAITSKGAMLRDLESTNGTTVGRVPVLVARLESAVEIAVGRTRIRFELDADDTTRATPRAEKFGLLHGRAPAMRRVFSQLGAAAATDSTVLLLGETGTGKELAAESLHRESSRAQGPFVIVDCGAVPSMLLDSQLFGHVRGSFTGAVASRVGAFEEASGGTLFLDEIGELAPELQPKLLRVLERKVVKPIGSNQWIPVDVRVVAATNRDLRPQVNQQSFRADLYYRLAVVVVTLPPLRERAEDVPLLIEALLASMGQASRPQAELLRSPQLLEELRNHKWSGNVRELRNYVERCLALDAAPSLPAHAASPPADVDLSAPFLEARERWLDRFELPYLTALLRQHNNNVSAAARAAGVDRTYLHKLLSRHGLR
ncbi:MAG: sigma 54-interacting transcriptional regulator [Kofleriaceae bacterium]|nr:sigma 54-interacting transcriptional regulator [Kofleriaceae bacterium]